MMINQATRSVYLQRSAIKMYAPYGIRMRLKLISTSLTYYFAIRGSRWVIGYLVTDMFTTTANYKIKSVTKLIMAYAYFRQEYISIRLRQQMEQPHTL